MTAIDDIFQPVIGLPCWLVTKVHGSILSIQFGRPRLIVNEPRVRTVHIDGVAPLAQRAVRVDGDWSLTIHLCDWHLDGPQGELAHSESDDITMNRALRALDGQQLVRVVVDQCNGATDFEFDLGCVLRCSPAAPGVYGDEPSEMWWVSDDGHFVSVRDDGCFCKHPTTVTRDDMVWSPLAP